MRITRQVVPIGLLICLPLISSCLEWRTVTVVLSLLGIFLIRQYLILIKLFGAKKDQKVILETIHISHYVEKVRWAMDFIGFEYEEEVNVGILGVIMFGRFVPTLSIPGKGISISESGDILKYLYGVTYADEAIRKFLEPTPEALKLEKTFNKFGEDLRRFCYGHIFKGNEVSGLSKKVWGMTHSKIPQWQKWLLNCLRPVCQLMVMRFVTTTDEAVEQSYKDVMSVIKQVDVMLSDGRKYLLKTDQPTWIDFHFASMMALALFLPQYGGKALTPDSRITLDDAKAMEKVVLQLRSSKAGQFVIKLYQDFRHASIHKRCC